MTEVLHKPDAWKVMAEDYARLAADGPTYPPTKTMVDSLNEAWPFSKATAILDTGCGPGVVIDRLLKDYGPDIPADARLLASDFSPAMIEQVKSKIQRETDSGNSIWGRVEASACDAQDLAHIADGSVSHATAGFVLFMVPDPQKALRETRRVLSSDNGGGLLALSSWEGSEWMTLFDLITEVKPDAQTVEGMLKNWKTAQGVKEEMEAGGFRDVQVHRVPTSMAFEDHDKICAFFVEKMPMLVEGLKDVPKEEVERLKKMMADKLREIRPEAPGRMTGMALVGIGRK